MPGGISVLAGKPPLFSPAGSTGRGSSSSPQQKGEAGEGGCGPGQVSEESEPDVGRPGDGKSNSQEPDVVSD